MGRQTAGLQSLACLEETGSAEGVLRACVLRYRPELFFVGELRIQFHENTWTMVSLGGRGGRSTLRLHKLFAKAPSSVLDAVVRSFFVPQDAGARRALRSSILEFIEANSQLALSSLSARRLRSPRGAAYDLKSIEEGVRKKFLPSCPSVRIGWSQRITQSLMGKWIATPDGLPNVIVINRLLDNSSVPLFYLEYVVFHELLHEVIPIRRKEGRWVHHPAEFRRRERQFPTFKQAVLWERTNVARLFDAQAKGADGWPGARPS
jgi:hypothetical protein